MSIIGPTPKIAIRDVDDIADETRDQMRRKPHLLDKAQTIADETVAELRRHLPDADPAVIGAVLLLASSHLGTHLLHALADEPLKADAFHLLVPNAMAVAGERLYSNGSR